MAQRKKVAKKKVSAAPDRMNKLKDQIAELKRENKALKQDLRKKDRQIGALRKALETINQRVARFLKREQKDLIKSYELIANPKRRPGRPKNT